MKIRSITYFCNPGWPLDQGKLRSAGEFLAEAKSAFDAEGFEVQTTRLATVPFPRLLGKTRLGETPRLAQEMSRLLEETGISYGALGPALPELPVGYAVIPEAIAAAGNIFFSGLMAITISSSSNIRAPRLMMSRWPLVGGSKVPGYMALSMAAL